MIRLYISSILCEKLTKKELAIKLASLNVECQIFDNYSSIISCGNNVESGFLILFINLSSKDLKETVWPYLQQLFDVKCAHVEAEDYKGCILNWPKVFRESVCSLVNVENSKKNT
tara:strand:+ start:6198 stop:6542 length:345 start_codon:yes stop_codon:yes gene_type:complete